MCPDDCDISCTLILAEIECTSDTIKWSRIGIDRTITDDANKVGSKVEWLDKIEFFEFELSEYKSMVAEFEKQFQADQKEWERNND